MPLAPLGNAQQYCSAFIFQQVFRGLCSVSPNWYDNAYSFCFTGAETEIDKIKDDGKIYRETNPDRRGPRQIGTV